MPNSNKFNSLVKPPAIFGCLVRDLWVVFGSRHGSLRFTKDGHASVETLLTYYASVSDEDKREAVRKMTVMYG